MQRTTIHISTSFARKRTTLRSVFVAVAIMAGSTAAFSQEDDSVSYKRKTVINFEDDTIEGDLKTPDGQYLETRKNMRHRSLIRIRRDFRREVLGSIADL